MKQKYEYKVDRNVPRGLLESRANEYAKEGWRVVSFVYDPGGESFVYFLEREVEPTSNFAPGTRPIPGPGKETSGVCR